MSALENAEEKRMNLCREYEEDMGRIAMLEKELESGGEGPDSEEIREKLAEAVLSSSNILQRIKDTEDEIFEVRIQMHSKKNSPPVVVSQKNIAKKAPPVKSTKPQAQPRQHKKTQGTLSKIRKRFVLRAPDSGRLKENFVNALKKPGKNTLLLPLRLFKYFVEVIYAPFSGESNGSTESGKP